MVTSRLHGSPFTPTTQAFSQRLLRSNSVHIYLQGHIAIRRFTNVTVLLSQSV